MARWARSPSGGWGGRFSVQFWARLGASSPIRVPFKSVGLNLYRDDRDSVAPHNDIVFHEAGVRKLMASYCSYYERSRTHLALDKDTPIPRPVMPPGVGDIVGIPQVGGLHHRYERRAA